MKIKNKERSWIVVFSTNTINNKILIKKLKEQEVFTEDSAKTFIGNN